MKFELAEWSSKIEVGLPEIDAQHRQLFELAATFAGDGEQIRVLKSLAMLTDHAPIAAHVVMKQILMTIPVENDRIVVFLFKFIIHQFSSTLLEHFDHSYAS